MAKNPKLSYLAAKAMLDGLKALFDGGAGAGYTEILDGTQPANGPDEAHAATVLATITWDDPAFGATADQAPNAQAAAAGVPKSDSSADNTGTATWCRHYDSNNTPFLDGSVGLTDSDLVLDDVNLVSGQEVKINSFTLTIKEVPAALP